MMRHLRPTPKKADKATSTVKVPASKFTLKTLKAISEDIVAGKYGKISKIGINDDIQPGLRAIIVQTGTISWHAGYMFKGSRPYLKIGESTTMSIDEAREMTEVIRELARKGINVQEGLHTRLLQELKRDGTKWRPALAPKP